MAKWKKITCLILAILLLVLAGFIIWQRDNVEAAILYIKTSSDDIFEQKEQLDQSHKEELEEATGAEIVVSLPSQEQCNALLDGTATAEQIKGMLGLDVVVDPSAGPVNTLSIIVNTCAAELAGYKVDAMAHLGTIKADVLTQWAALPAEEKTSSKKAAMIMEGLQLCYAYESEMDALVQACLGRHRQALEAIGEDPAVMDLFWDQYCEEKVTEKAFYMDRYLN